MSLGFISEIGDKDSTFPSNQESSSASRKAGEVPNILQAGKEYLIDTPGTHLMGNSAEARPFPQHGPDYDENSSSRRFVTALLSIYRPLPMFTPGSRTRAAK